MIETENPGVIETAKIKVSRISPRPGTVVRNKNGRGGDGFFIVVSVENSGFVKIADGRTRKLSAPKLKNIKHIEFLSEGVLPEQMSSLTDKKLRALLFKRNFPDEYRRAANDVSGNLCLEGGNNYGKKT